MVEEVRSTIRLRAGLPWNGHGAGMMLLVRCQRQKIAEVVCAHFLFCKRLYLSNVTAKINDPRSAYEISLFLTFTLFCAVPRTMNPYDFYPWYPKGIRSFIAAGANHYVATFDKTTVRTQVSCCAARRANRTPG
jgi:hypothetical protein